MKQRVGLLSLMFLLWATPIQGQAPVVVQIDLDDVIHPVSADYLKQGLDHARDIGAQAVIVRLNTPGGLMESMRHVVEDILASKVPVITFVGPNGSRAASAGFFILLAGDLAVMAPATNSGAAHPVTITGAKIEDVMEKKIVSDASAYIRSYATKRGRNANLAEKAVVDSASFTAEEALRENLIDGVVSDVPAILQRYDGKEIRRFNDETTTLKLQGASVEMFSMGPRQRLLSSVMDPNVAFILALLGLICIYVEVTHPGMILPGVVGAISMVLALYAFNLLPVNWTGALLIAVAITLFVLEATITSHGVLATGGGFAMIAGGLVLVDGPIPQMRVHLATVLAVTIPVALITVFLVRLVFLSQRRKSVTGQQGMIGEMGVAVSDIHPEGKVLVHGEYWNAESGTRIAAGTKVRVVNVHGLKVQVEADT